ncbi:rhodanese-like domain-containing protein [Shimia thalassica]|uniref:rhodanese-like domain-containing protein n=1 Tax=Shimia thalassica TaxID=1715693 RepID=UPI001C09179C|nr:rhodanese-like domain-containing protein [Shimia thalassica]MBU2941174.1 rhodanese-like domain-containing protein [Shimia thalassica]MDO6480500.1 rhodanese-like domain-containing protein [Shimia thalassica]MDO6483854.1 rhodanese-like domain-containing protein [Shimia thalassica]MDO6503341.1 rhodanese-like domain-containing protein [Shimia thalassica]MDO6798704.1 rhodanese-like domain-containing protein [Shimia thalassica]
MPITPVKTLVAEAKEQIETLPQTEVETLLASDEIVLLDIRDIRELKRDGRIPGAIHAPRGMLEFWIDPESPYHKPDFATDKKLVLFCASAWRSALAVKNLQDIGVENIAEMADGFSAWKSRGAAVETD